MKLRLSLLLFVLVIFADTIWAQPAAAPSCPTQSIYAHNGSIINGCALPNGPPINVLANLPAGAGGLAIGPAFGFPAPNPTWWTTNAGTYWYYNNAGGWTNTGHALTNGAAVNLGGGATRLYNLVGASGQIYMYNGTGPDVLLNTLVPSFGGAGPYDVQGDFADNFYILRGSNPQGIFCYNPQGVLTCSWSITGMIQQVAGGGFCILPTATPSIHRMYYNSNGTDYIGDMIPGNPVIISTVQALPSGGDYASCALPVPIASITAPQGGTLTCNLPQIPLVAQVWGNGALNWTGGYGTPTTSPVSPTCGAILWSGPGIVSGQGTPTIIVNQPGVYSFTLSGCGSCPNYSMTASYTVIGMGGLMVPIITAPNCFTGPSTMSVSPNTPTNTVTWTGPGIVGPNNTFTINFNLPGVYSVVVSSGTNCSGSASIMVNASPTVTALANPSVICNGQSSTLTASGAGINGTYTWNPGGIPGVSLVVSPTVATVYTVIGTSSAGCTGTGTVLMNLGITPTITATPNPSSICIGNSANVSLNGAVVYTTNPGNITSPFFMVTPTVTTNYTVLGVSPSGCTNTANFQIVVNPLPTITVNSPTICSNIPLILTANGANTYNWSGPNGFTSSQQNPVLMNAQPNMTGQYLVIGTSAAGCTANAVSNVSVIPVPAPAVSCNTPCVGGALSLIGSGGSTYTWTGPGFMSNIQSPTITNVSILNGGVYTLSVSIGFCTSGATINAVVNPLPTATLTSNAPVCERETMTMMGITGGLTYQWQGPNNFSGIGSNISIPNVGMNHVGTYTATLTDVNGCVGYSTISVNVYSLPMVATQGATVCANTTITLTASGGTGYNWTGPNAFTASTPTVFLNNASLDMIGTYSVEVTNANNCRSTGVVHVSVNPMPTVTAGYSGPVCTGGNLTLTANATNVVLYSWRGPLDFLTVLQNPPLSGLSTEASGIYTVFVHDALGCEGYGFVNVLVRPLPQLNITSDKLSSCVPLCINLGQQSNNQIVSTQWQYGNGDNGFGANTSYCFKYPGHYQISANYTDNYGCKNISTLGVNAWPIPTADFNMSPGSPVINENIDFTDASRDAQAAQWTWYFSDDNNKIMQGQNVSRYFENEGSYSAVLIVTSDHGCKDTIVKPVIVGEGFGIYVPDAFTPNGDGHNDIFQPKGYGITRFEMSIFDRWGERLFTSNSFEQGWDGKFSGRGGDIVKMDVYVWKIKLTDSFGKSHEYSGKVSLIK